MSLYNRLHNTTNPYQGTYKKVLCVCSAGLLRSPTVAWVLSNKPYNFNTRAVGLDKDWALIPMDDVLIGWADQIVCVEKSIYDRVLAQYHPPTHQIVHLNIPDKYAYRHPELVDLIRKQYDELVSSN